MQLKTLPLPKKSRQNEHTAKERRQDADCQHHPHARHPSMRRNRKVSESTDIGQGTQKNRQGRAGMEQDPILRRCRPVAMDHVNAIIDPHAKNQRERDDIGKIEGNAPPHHECPGQD